MAVSASNATPNSWSDQVKNSEQYKVGHKMGSEMSVMGAVRMIGGAMIMLGIILVVLNEVFTLDTINNSSGPFADVIDSTETTGGAALGLLVVGLLAAAGNRIMGMFGGGGF